MDVSGWNLASKMKLPDHLFGNRVSIGISIFTAPGPDMKWYISRDPLPNQVCIWDVAWYPRQVGDFNSYFRIGYRAAVPTSEAEMNTAVPLMPQIGNYAYTPPRIYLSTASYEVWRFLSREGQNTGGLKLVMEIYTLANISRGIFVVTYSELPTKVPGWPGAWPAG